METDDGDGTEDSVEWLNWGLVVLISGFLVLELAAFAIKKNLRARACAGVRKTGTGGEEQKTNTLKT